MTTKINGHRIKYSLDGFSNLMELKKLYKNTTIPLDLLKSACNKDGLNCGKGYPVLNWPPYMKMKEKEVVDSTSKKKIKNVIEEKEENENMVEHMVEEIENPNPEENEGYDVDEFKDEDSDIEQEC